MPLLLLFRLIEWTARRLKLLRFYKVKSMTYQPKPIDTTGIDLRPLQGVTEFLAEQVHEAWAAKRIAEGWSLGPARDDAKRQTPNLVPYQALSEEDKDYDRRLLTHALGLLVLKGYRIVPPESDTLLAPNGELTHLSQEDFEQISNEYPDMPEPLRERLTVIDTIFASSFRDWDSAARHYQTKYLRASLACTICVFLAIALALYQVAGYPSWGMHFLAIPLIELGLVGLASLLVLRDFQNEWKDNWLINRIRAERIRSLKYRVLLDSDFWRETSRPEVEAKLHKAVHELSLAGPKNLPTWLELCDVVTPSMRLSGDMLLDKTVCDYYFQSRLIAQLNHATRKAHEHERKDHRTKIYGTVLFFAVLAFVFSHVLIDLVGHTMHAEPVSATLHDNSPGETSQPSSHPGQFQKADSGSQIISRLLALLAALVPAIGAALHVYRSGREAGRNHLRMKALGLKLGVFRSELERPSILSQHLSTMAQCENALLAEQQQWLQLMKECEWYG